MNNVTKKTKNILMLFALIFGIATIFMTAKVIPVCANEVQPSTAWYDNADSGATSYEISTPADLMGLAQLVNSGNDFSGKTITMSNDIDLSGVDNWTTIGVSDGIYENEKCFMGNFDGDNHTIKNFKILDETDYTDQDTVGTILKNNYGLFSITDGSIIKNLTVEGNITLTHPVNHERVTICGFTGGIIGCAYGTTIENCHFNGNISSGYVVGGIVGRGLYSSIKNCSTKGNITGSYYVGGIAGQLYGNYSVNMPANASYIDGCSAEGAITANISYAAGGIVGSAVNPLLKTNAYTYFSNCMTKQGTTVTGPDAVGGIAGEACAEIKNCFNHADVIQKNNGPTAKCYAAGIVASIPALVGEGVTECVNYGSVSAEKISDAAGLICSGTTAIKITNSANVGNVSADTGSAYGLICGTSDAATINNSFNVGTVTGATAYPLGQTGTYTNVYYDSKLGESTVGEAKATEDFSNRTVVDLLNGDAETPVWFQNVDYPDFAANMTPVENVTIGGKAEVGINKEVSLTTSITPDDATNKGVVYTSSDETIATVTEDGKVKGVKAGQADITVMALYDGTKAVCKVTVKDLDQEAADAVIAELKAIDPSKATLEELEAVQKKYDALTPEQKALVDANADAVAAKQAIDAKVKELEKESQTPQKEPAKGSATVAVKKGAKFNVKGYKFTVTSNLKKNPTVTITGYKNKKLKKITVPATVKYKKITFKVSAIGKAAFKNQKKATSAVVGNNVKNIGVSAFEGDVKLVKITVKSAVLTKVGKKALKNTPRLKAIKVPKKKLKKYKKFFKGKGQKKTVKITK